MCDKAVELEKTIVDKDQACESYFEQWNPSTNTRQCRRWRLLGHKMPSSRKKVSIGPSPHSALPY